MREKVTILAMRKKDDGNLFVNWSICYEEVLRVKQTVLSAPSTIYDSILVLPESVMKSIITGFLLPIDEEKLVKVDSLKEFLGINSN